MQGKGLQIHRSWGCLRVPHLPPPSAPGDTAVAPQLRQSQSPEHGVGDTGPPPPPSPPPAPTFSHTHTHRLINHPPISSHTSLYLFTHTTLRHTHSQSHAPIHTHWFVLSHLGTLAHRPAVTCPFTPKHTHSRQSCPQYGAPDTLCQPCFCLLLGRWWHGGGVPLRKRLHSCERRGFLAGDVLAGGRGDPTWSGLLVQPPKIPSPRHTGWPQSTLPSHAH